MRISSFNTVKSSIILLADYMHVFCISRLILEMYLEIIIIQMTLIEILNCVSI